MIRPTAEEWEVYQKVISHWPVYKIADIYRIDQEQVLQIYFNCMQWKQDQDGELIRDYSNKRRKYTRR